MAVVVGDQSRGAVTISGVEVKELRAQVWGSGGKGAWEHAMQLASLGRLIQQQNQIPKSSP